MSGKNTVKRHKWSLDLSLRSKSDRQPGQELAPIKLTLPLGFTDKKTSDQAARDDSGTSSLIVKKSWDIATGPLKQVPMNLFIMWMAGNSISIFPIMMVGMMFMRPVQALLAIQQTFKMIEGNMAILQRIVYLLGNLVGLALAVYKCQVMGLLPTHPSDWLAFVEPQSRLEWSGGGMTL